MATISLLKSGNYRAQIRVKNLKHISGTFLTKKEAEVYISRIESEIDSIYEAESGKLPIDMGALFQSLHPDLKCAVRHLPVFMRVLGSVWGSELTLAGLIDEFVYQYTKKDYNIYLRLKWWSDRYGSVLVKDVTEDHIRLGLNELIAHGCTGKKGVSPQTTNRYKANISSVFEFGKQKYHLKHNPCRDIKAKPEGKGRKRYLTDEEQRRFLIAARQSRWEKFYLLVLMAITSGARKSELLGLRFNSIDWENGTAVCSDCKNGSDKKLMFTSSVMQELRKYRQVGNGLIFCNPRKPSVPYDYRKEWNDALSLADISVLDDKGEKLVFHSLRHTFCSTLANRGAELHEIATLAGHKSMQTTMRYTHIDNTRSFNVMNNAFGDLS